MRQIIEDTLRRLIEEGRLVLGKPFNSGGYHGVEAVPIQPFAKWHGGCLNLLRMLGHVSEPWKEIFAVRINALSQAEVMLGTLEAIQEAASHGLLVKVEDLVRAEAFEGLLEQAEYLDGEGYFLAAGVLGRAVLESHLRKWCEIAKCSPSKPKPTLNDLNASLYRERHINLTEMKHIESMTAVGNEAAHNGPTLTQDSVKRLLRDVRDLLVKHPLSH